MGVKDFVRRYQVFFIFIPSFVGVHWVWFRIQEIDSLVPPHQRQPSPFIRMYDAAKDELIPRMMGTKEVEESKPGKK